MKLSDIGKKIDYRYYATDSYTRALQSREIDSGTYGLDTARDIVLRFLGNASGWRGPKAKEVKAELRKWLVENPKWKTQQ